MTSDTVLLRCTACRTLNRLPVGKMRDQPVCGKCRAPLKFPVSPVNATDPTFEHEVNDWPMATLVEFMASWCGHCRMIGPAVNDLAAKRAGFLKVITVDVDREPGLSSRFSIKGTPTFLLYLNGRLLARLDGAPEAHSELEDWISQTLMKHGSAFR